MTASALGLALVVGGVTTAARSSDRADPPMERVEAQYEALAPRLEPRVLPERESRPVVAASSTEKSKKRVSEAQRQRRHPAAGEPERVSVPKLRIDVPVVGIDAPGGVLTPPDDPQVLGWWRAGAPPGARQGSALITGHTVSSGGGALDDLETLRRGDRATVHTARGTVRYRVTGVRIYRKAALAEHAARVFSQEVPGRLVLITCEDWNGTTYESNVVVTAEPRTADR